MIQFVWIWRDINVKEALSWIMACFKSRCVISDAQLMVDAIFVINNKDSYKGHDNDNNDKNNELSSA